MANEKWREWYELDKAERLLVKHGLINSKKIKEDIASAKAAKKPKTPKGGN